MVFSARIAISNANAGFIPSQFLQFISNWSRRMECTMNENIYKAQTCSVPSGYYLISIAHTAEGFWISPNVQDTIEKIRQKHAKNAQKEIDLFLEELVALIKEPSNDPKVGAK
jgi:hypothetical protein